ncbi:hypothetical protein [Dysgonomonas capnocytophagoides]|uniref:hypothetical protein n=1 Tax=Dysgonomonas capnocytophagoides TaxID=45254 RepID=UPI0030C7BEEF
MQENWTEQYQWRAVYMETCTYGSEASSWKPIIEIWKGAGYLAYLQAIRNHPRYIINRKRIIQLISRIKRKEEIV